MKVKYKQFVTLYLVTITKPCTKGVKTLPNGDLEIEQKGNKMTNQNNKIYTFEIQYNGVDSFSTIQFCAHSKNEAIELFNDWCRNDNHTEPVTI